MAENLNYPNTTQEILKRCYNPNGTLSLFKPNTTQEVLSAVYEPNCEALNVNICNFDENVNNIVDPKISACCEYIEGLIDNIDCCIPQPKIPFPINMVELSGIFCKCGDVADRRTLPRPIYIKTKIRVTGVYEKNTNYSEPWSPQIAANRAKKKRFEEQRKTITNRPIKRNIIYTRPARNRF